ncbi:MAG TPA: histidine--tRNA ligase [Patescibacteria group bacterium]|nr:histidine--tRNA ligase [Patescibacteria group bacterium]
MIKKMPNIIPPVKGTRDFYPKDWAFIQWLYDKVKEVSRLFGFEEYEGPTLESLDLYAAKSGEELVKKQAFTLTDQSGKVLALRPEMTPSLARMVAQKAGSLTFPVKWFTFGRRFRYEKPQKGRGREFFQWDCDILGVDNPEADTEVIAIAATLLKKLGLEPTEVKIKVNDRQLLQGRLQDLGITEEKIVPAFRLIDKVDKVSRKDFFEMGQEAGLTDEQTEAILGVIEEKNAYLDSSWLLRVFELLKKYGVSEFIEYDPRIVRGLEYYTGVVFEAWDAKGEFRSILGGGRYDNLTAEVGGRKIIPGTGFASGDMVVAEVLRAYDKYPKLSVNPTQVLVTAFSVELLGPSIELANKLRESEINTEVFLEPGEKLEKQIKYADRKGIPYVAILGPDEAAKGTVTLKNLRDGTQETIPQSEMAKILKQ